MKHIIEHIYNKINEHADGSYKKLFGRTIVFSPSIKDKLLKSGLNFRHAYDNFIVYEDGCVEYTNPHMFTGAICAKVYKDRINRYIGSNDRKYINICCDDASTCNDFDLSDNPFNYFRAVLNALTSKTYTSDPLNIIITDIDYTKGDFETDKKVD